MSAWREAGGLLYRASEKRVHGGSLRLNPGIGAWHCRLAGTLWKRQEARMAPRNIMKHTMREPNVTARTFMDSMPRSTTSVSPRDRSASAACAGRRSGILVVAFVSLVAGVVLGTAPSIAWAQSGQEPVGVVRSRRLPLLPRRAARMEARGEIVAVPLGQPRPGQTGPRPTAPPATGAAPSPGRSAAASATPRAPSPSGTLATTLLERARAALPGLLDRVPATPAAPASGTRTVEQATRLVPTNPRAQDPGPDVASPAALAPVAGDAARAVLVGRPEPFTPAWHDAYPQAWTPTGTADWWQQASASAIDSRLARLANAPRVWTVDGQIVDAPPPADGTRSVLVDGPTTTAESGWLPLGIFASFAAEPATLVTADAPEPLGWQQLAIGSDGAIRGNHYDAISDVVQPISGRVDPRTRLATWTIGGGRGARFETPVATLAESAARAQATIGGAARPWTLVPLTRPAQATVAGEPVELLPTPGR